MRVQCASTLDRTDPTVPRGLASTTVKTTVLIINLIKKKENTIVERVIIKDPDTGTRRSFEMLFTMTRTIPAKTDIEMRGVTTTAETTMSVTET